MYIFYNIFDNIFYIIFTYISEKLQLCIFKTPTFNLNYDWTFSFGSNIWDTIDFRTILTQNYLPKQNESEEKKQNDDDDEAEDDEKSMHQKRKQAYKIDTTFLILCGQREFVHDIAPTPGIFVTIFFDNIFIYIFDNIFMYIFYNIFIYIFRIRRGSRIFITSFIIDSRK